MSSRSWRKSVNGIMTVLSGLAVVVALVPLASCSGW